jgi:CheY-like chemotaxis protein
MKVAPLIKVMYVDDDIDDHFIFSRILDDIEIKTELTTVTESENFIISVLQSELPDVIFLDLNMPRKNGYECLAEIKQSEELKHIPVVIYSTSYYKSILDILYKAGAFYCIHKSTERDQTKAMIKNVLESVLTGKQQPARNRFVLGL